MGVEATAELFAGFDVFTFTALFELQAAVRPSVASKVKKTISFPATITVGADAASGTAEFVINRKDFGIVYPGKQDDLIRDDVLLKLSLKAPRKKG